MQYKCVPCNVWDMIILKQISLFIWRSDLTRHPVFYLAALCGALVRSTYRPCSPSLVLTQCRYLSWAAVVRAPLLHPQDPGLLPPGSPPPIHPLSYGPNNPHRQTLKGLPCLLVTWGATAQACSPWELAGAPHAWTHHACWHRPAQTIPSSGLPFFLLWLTRLVDQAAPLGGVFLVLLSQVAPSSLGQGFLYRPLDGTCPCPVVTWEPGPPLHPWGLLLGRTGSQSSISVFSGPSPRLVPQTVAGRPVFTGDY